MELHRVKVVQSTRTPAMIHVRRVHRVRILIRPKLIASKVNSIHNCPIHSIRLVSDFLIKYSTIQPTPANMSAIFAVLKHKFRLHFSSRQLGRISAPTTGTSATHTVEQLQSTDWPVLCAQ